MKRLVVGAALLAAVPFCAQAQSPLQPGGFYITAEGGANWLLNSSFTSTLSVAPLFTGSTTTNASYNTGFVLGGAVGYDFVGPRLEVEGVYRDNTGSLTITGLSGNAGVNFNRRRHHGERLLRLPRRTVVRSLCRRRCGCRVPERRRSRLDGTEHAVRLSGHRRRGLEHRPDLPSQPGRPLLRHDDAQLQFLGQRGRLPVHAEHQSPEQQYQPHAGPADEVRRRAAAAATPAAAAGGAAVVHGVLRLGPLEPLAAGAGDDRAGGQAFKAKGNARITATGHTDTSGPESLQHGAVAASRERGQGRAGA